MSVAVALRLYCVTESLETLVKIHLFLSRSQEFLIHCIRSGVGNLISNKFPRVADAPGLGTTL